MSKWLHIPELDSVKSCNKCGYEPGFNGFARFYMEYQRPNYESNTYPDSIKRTCPRCGYYWFENSKS